MSFSETPLGRHGKLLLKKSDTYGNAPVITDSHGQPFQLRGASTHGMHWFPDYVNREGFQSLRDEWGINLIRLVSYVTQGGYTQGSRDMLDRKIEEGVGYATDLGLYVMIDWHIHNEDPNDTLEDAKEFFRRYSEKYKDHDNVIYEICNEPGDIDWYNGSGRDLYSYCSAIVDTIRANDSDALIVCGTKFYSQGVDQIASKPLGDDKVLYSLHFYAQTHYSDLQDKLRAAVDAGTPVYITEFGICDAAATGNSCDEANADAWIELADSYNISFNCWSLCNKDEPSSYLKPQCAAVSGWKQSDLATTGIWLVKTCRAHEEKEQSSAKSLSPAAEGVLAGTIRALKNLQ